VFFFGAAERTQQEYSQPVPACSATRFDCVLAIWLTAVPFWTMRTSPCAVVSWRKPERESITESYASQPSL